MRASGSRGGYPGAAVRTDRSVEKVTGTDPQDPSTTGDAGSSRYVRVLRPRKSWAGLGLGQIWVYRELLYFFTWRNVKVRYKQTIIGAGWAVLQPFFMMIAFTLLFGRVANISTGGIPRPVFYYAALLPWNYFATTVSTASESVTQSQALITKVYFPRVMLPISFGLSSLLDLLIACSLLVALMLYYGLAPTVAILLVPVFIALALIFAVGVGLWTSALNAIYRDVRYAVPFLIQFGLFVSPVIYSSTRIPKAWRTLYFLNPMASVIDGFRWALTGVGQRPGVTFLASAVVALFVLLSGAWFFRRTEGLIADLV